MFKHKHGITLFFVFCAALLGPGLFSLPTAAAHFGSTMYWLCLFCAMLLILIVSSVFHFAVPGTFFDACSAALPKAARTLTLFYALFYTAISAGLLAYYTHTVQGWFLGGVPRTLIALFLSFVCLCTAMRPADTVHRLVGLCMVFVLLAVIGMRCLLVYSGDWRNLLPAWEAPQLQAMPEGSIFLSGFFVLLGYGGCMKVSRRCKHTAAMSAIVFCTCLLLLATAGCISILGPLQTAQHLNSSVLAMKSLNPTNMDFFQRGDLIFILTWSVLILSSGTLSTHLPLSTLRTLYPGCNAKLLCAAFFTVCMSASCLIPSEESALLYLVYTALPGAALFLILIPLLLLFFKRRKRVEKTH